MSLGSLLGPMSREDLQELAREGAIMPADQIRQGDDGCWRPVTEVRGLFEECRSERDDAAPDAENVVGKRRSPKGHQNTEKMQRRLRAAENSSSRDGVDEIETQAEPIRNEKTIAPDVLLSSEKAETQTGIADDDFGLDLPEPSQLLQPIARAEPPPRENSRKPKRGDPISVPGGRRKRIARKRATLRRPHEEAGEPDCGVLNFGRLAAMARRAESIGKGTVEACVSCGELVGEFTEECPHCGERHAEQKQIKKEAARINAEAQDTVIIEDKRDYEKLARTGEWGRRGPLVQNSRQQNKVIYTLLYVWNSIPTMAKALGFIAVATYFIIIVPLLAFQRQSYLDEGGPYGHNTTDTIYYAKALNTGKESVADWHLARRELRKALVRVHVRVTELKDDGVVPEKGHDNYQSALLAVADEYLLTKNMWGDDMGGLLTQTIAMAALTAQVNAFADKLQDEEVVALLDDMVKDAVGEDD